MPHQLCGTLLGHHIVRCDCLHGSHQDTLGFHLVQNVRGLQLRRRESDDLFYYTAKESLAIVNIVEMRIATSS